MLNFENFSLSHLRVPSDELGLPENRIESKNRIMIEEVTVIL